MEGWDSALGKNKSAFHVLGWGRANREGPYVLTLPQERRGRIWAESGLAPVHLRPSFQARPAQLLGVVLPGRYPKNSKGGCPASPEVSEQRTSQGFPGSISQKKNSGVGVRNFMRCHQQAGQGKEQCVGTPCEWARGRRGKANPPRNTTMSRVAHISIILSFGLVASKTP